DKVDSSDRERIEAELKKVKDALEKDDTDAIKSATEGLTKVFYEVSAPACWYSLADRMRKPITWWMPIIKWLTTRMVNSIKLPACTSLRAGFADEAARLSINPR
ncbi:MAG TPA: hypothetical protein PLE53_05095, partial [Bacillota bacterium]|nr:hypothetical protein [Bacillota bacterium]